MEVRNISFAYGDEPVLKNVSLSLTRGRHIAVMGESGRGKTTLMRLLLGFIEPTEGVIERGQYERPAAVFQESRLLPWYTALKNVELAAAPGKNAMELLEDMELGESADKLPKELSGGMQRRAAIARALAFGGDLLLLDEPFSGLDPELKERIAGKILKHAGDSPILLITHDEKEAELLKCEETVRL